MKESKKIKKNWLNLRLDEDELKLLKEYFSQSTERKLGTYARKVLLKQGVTIIHRNGSMDEYIGLLVKVQKDLNGLCNNYNQMVHKLHMAGRHPQILAWVNLYEQQRKHLFATVEHIKELVERGVKQWLQ